MGLFDFFKKSNFMEMLEVCQNTPQSKLIDVREVDEYQQAHIPNSINIPLSLIPIKIQDYVNDKDTPIFLYCLSGARSYQAQSLLKKMGYTNLTNLGGLHSYRGPFETKR